MAYIGTEQVAQIRKTLKVEFPEIKFSVRREHYSKVNVVILQSPYEFLPAEKMSNGGGYMGVNQYWFKTHGYNHVDVLDRIIKICNTGNHDNSDIMTDYFDVGWYFDLSLGTWEKPYKLVA